MWEQRGGESGAQLGTTLGITSTNICTKKRYEVHDHILLMKPKIVHSIWFAISQISNGVMPCFQCITLHKHLLVNQHCSCI